MVFQSDPCCQICKKTGNILVMQSDNSNQTILILAYTTVRCKVNWICALVIKRQ